MEVSASSPPLRQRGFDPAADLRIALDIVLGLAQHQVAGAARRHEVAAFLFVRQRQVPRRQQEGGVFVDRHVRGCPAAVPVAQFRQRQVEHPEQLQQALFVSRARALQRAAGEISVAGGHYTTSLGASPRGRLSTSRIRSCRRLRRPARMSCQPVRHMPSRIRGFERSAMRSTSQNSELRPRCAHHLAEFLRQHRHGESRRIELVLDGLALEAVHDVGDVDLTGTVDRAGVTGCAQPDGLGTQRILAKTFPDEGYNAARAEIHVNGERAGARARTALKAGEQTLAAGTLANLAGPLRVCLALKL